MFDIEIGDILQKTGRNVLQPEKVSKKVSKGVRQTEPVL